MLFLTMCVCRVHRCRRTAPPAETNVVDKPLPLATDHTAGTFDYRSVLRKTNLLDVGSDDKAVVDIRLRPRFSAAAWWVTVSIRCGVKSVLPRVESL